MKHNIFSGIIAVLFVQFLCSCNKQLDEYNPGGASVENLITSPEGFEAAVNGVYTYNRSLYGKEEGVGLLEVGTDIWASAAADLQTSLTSYQNFTPDQPWLNKLWQPCYGGINLCNLALKHIGEAGLATARRPVLEAELRFMRAWYYWHLVETFGDTHFTLEPTDGMITTANRTPVAKIYDQIFTDMNFAVTNLPPTTGDYGRVTKPVAEAFLARLCLTRGKDQEASNYAYSVIKNYGFKLLSNYADLWNMSNQKNTEIVWATNYSTTLTYNSGSNLMHMLFMMDYNTLPGMTRDLTNGYAGIKYMPTLSLLNLFNENDDARYNASFKQAWIANNTGTPSTIPVWTATEVANNPVELAGLEGHPKFAVGDTAVLITKYPIDDFQQKYTTHYRYRTYDVNDVYNADGTTKDRSHYISLKKFDDPTRTSANETQSSRDVFIFRLAEMYLIASEAQMKLGKTDSAAYFVNEVRTRAALPGHTAAMQVGAGAVTLDFLLDERARELAGELLRWFDLKRTNKLVERITNMNPNAKPYIKSFHIVRPIPQSQIDAVTNKTEFLQTADYR